MTKDLDKLPLNILRLIEPLFIPDEKLLQSFHESFNWDITRTWAVLTNKRIFIANSDIFGDKVNEYNLSGLSVEYRQDDIGPYDTINLKIMKDSVYEIAVWRSRREYAKRFTHLISEMIGNQDKNKKESNEISECNYDLELLRSLGLVSDKEYLEQKLKNKCK